MALTKAKKTEVVNQVSEILANSKLTVMAKYQGTSVKDIQELRQMAKDSSTGVKVFKNRLVIQAVKSNPAFKDIDTEIFKDMLLYAFSSEDEVLPAQTLAKFAKTNPNLQFVGALSSDGTLMSSDDVKQLASLPSKENLRAMLVGTIKAPLSGFSSVISANLRGLVNVLDARSKVI